MATVLVDNNVVGTSTGTTEAVTAALPFDSPVPQGRVRLRVNIQITTGTGGTQITVKIRQGPTSGITGAVVATTGTLVTVASDTYTFQLEGLDTTDYIFGPGAGGGWVVTVTENSGTWTVNSIYACAELVP